MVVIVENGQITGIDKNFFNLIGADISEISDIVNLLSLQIASVTHDEIEIKNESFIVKEIEIVSLKNLKLYELEHLKKDRFNEVEDIKIEINEPILQDESIPKETSEEFPEIKISSIFEETAASQTDEIKGVTPHIEEKTEETAEIKNEISEIDDKNELSDLIDLKIQEELLKPQPVQQSQTETETPVEEKTEITEEIVKEQEKTEEPKEITLTQNEMEEIEVSFEDDLAEIRQILELSAEDFNKEIMEELEKASEELGIPSEDLNEFYEQLIDQILDEKSIIYKNISKNDYKNLHESYHKLKGAALNLRLSKIALILKKLDELSKANENIEKIKAITDNFYSLIENKQIKPHEIKNILNEENDEPKNVITEIVLDTIKTYLNTQNEEQFQKDKKYIEKLLNQKIETLEDLEKIIKGIQ